MNVFSLSTSTYDLQDKIHFYSMSSNSTKYVCNQSVANKINKLKEQINRVDDLWDYTKKMTNPYEYIHTIIPNTNISIAKYKPLSRAYFKMIEIIDVFNLTWDHPIRSFHLAEGPGGFIEALFRRRRNHQDKYVGMTLVTSKHHTPGWRKAKRFLSKWKERIRIEPGYDKTGNLFVYDNYTHLKDSNKNTYDLVTGDGGFDFSICYNMQECLSSRLVFAQIVYALMLLNDNGVFVLKLFDCYTRATLDMIWILCSVFNEVQIIKPYTSRYANSERYIVCKGYRYTAGQRLLPKLEFILEKLETPPPGMNIERLLSIELPLQFMNEMNEINSIFAQQQTEMIQTTLSIIDMNEKDRNERLRTMQYNNIQKCIRWCKNHNEHFTKLNTSYADALSNDKYRSPALR
mgnify:CR=1 FL=1